VKILFVCHGGVGRSQMGSAFYNAMTNTNNAEAAATDMVHLNPGAKTIREWEIENDRKSSANQVMGEIGLSTIEAKRMQLTHGMLNQYDLVINIAAREQTPDWLRGDNVVWWDMPDPGFAHTIDEVLQTRDKIKERVALLVDLEKTGGDLHSLDDNIDAEDGNG